MRLARVPASLRASEVVAIRVAIAHGEVWVAFEARARVVHLGSLAGEAGLEFVALPPRAREMLRSLAAAAEEGALKRLDASPAAGDWGLALADRPGQLVALRP